MEAKRRKLFKWLLGALLAVTLWFIWGNSLLGGKDSAELSGGALLFLQNLGLPLMDDRILRKLAHFTEFAVLGAELSLLLALCQGPGLQSASNAAFAALAAAVADESLQILSPERSAQVSDILLDFAGALTGLVFARLLVWLVGRKRKK